jgi:hypothetical protein
VSAVTRARERLAFKAHRPHDDAPDEKSDL